MENIVDFTAVINMDKDTQRLEEFNSMMIASNWNYSRKSAINGRKLLSTCVGLDTPQELRIETALMKKYVATDAWMSPSEIGCLLSHVSLWEDLVNDPQKNRIAIFEDDARTHISGNTVLELLTEFYTHLNDNNIEEPDILYLGKALDDCENYKHVWKNVYRSKHPLCLHAYIITKIGARKLLNLAPYKEAIDLIPVRGANKNLVNLMVFHPSIYFQDVLNNGSNQRGLGLSLNITAECLISQQHLAPDTWSYVAILIIGLIVVIILFVVFISPSNIFSIYFT